ncbi:MAG: hypothetical protein AB7G11_05275 [Phycisphaerales bacterium]
MPNPKQNPEREGQLTKAEVTSLREHRLRLDDRLEALRSDMLALGVRLDAGTMRKALAGSKRLSAVILRLLRAYLQAKEHDLIVWRHGQRYTGRILSDRLYSEHVIASHFKKALVRAFTTDHIAPSKSGGPLPRRIAFVNQTGQWLKPILRKLLQHPLGARVEVYVCDPASVHQLPTGGPEMSELLGVLEFLWGLPTSLGLDKAHSKSRLDIYTYDGATHDQRLAYFEGDMVARSMLHPMRKTPRVAGHPATAEGTRCFLGPEFVEVALSGHPKFQELSDQVRECLVRGKEALVRGHPRISWTAATGFEGLVGPGAFSIDPRAYLCPKSPEIKVLASLSESKPPTN